LFLVRLGFPAFAQQTAPADQPVLPRDLEIELALNAAPKHLCDGAAVLVLDSGGYVKAREGSNASRASSAGAAAMSCPSAGDAEGVKSLLPIDLDAAKARWRGARTRRSNMRCSWIQGRPLPGAVKTGQRVYAVAAPVPDL
jgi:hypothetical protein